MPLGHHAAGYCVLLARSCAQTSLAPSSYHSRGTTPSDAVGVCVHPCAGRIPSIHPSYYPPNPLSNQTPPPTSSTTQLRPSPPLHCFIPTHADAHPSLMMMTMTMPMMPLHPPAAVRWSLLHDNYHNYYDYHIHRSTPMTSLTRRRRRRRLLLPLSSRS